MPSFSFGRPMRWLMPARPNFTSSDSNASRLASATCTTAPSSSLNSARKVASAQPSRCSSRPQWPAKAISSKVVMTPPSERSW